MIIGRLLMLLPASSVRGADGKLTPPILVFDSLWGTFQTINILDPENKLRYLLRDLVAARIGDDELSDLLHGDAHCDRHEFMSMTYRLLIAELPGKEGNCHRRVDVLLAKKNKPPRSIGNIILREVPDKTKLLLTVFDVVEFVTASAGSEQPVR